MTSKERRRYGIGDAVVWTSYVDGSRHPCTILGYVEPDADDGYDPSASGPVYSVQLNPGETWETQVAEVDLSPGERPQLSLVDGKPKPPPVRDVYNSGTDDIA